MPREENHKANIMVELATLEMTKMLVNILIEITEVPCTKHMLINTIKERED